ncbi:MAG: magnesium transporter [Halanaerobiales bacterium]
MERIEDLSEHRGDELVFELQKRIEKNRNRRFNKWLDKRQPYDLARALNALEEKQLGLLIKKANNINLAEIISESEKDLQEEIISQLQSKRAADVVGYLPSDEAVDILLALNSNKREAVLNHLSGKQVELLRSLMTYKEETAGSLMSTEYVAYRSSLTVAETLKKIREWNREVVNLDNIFVLTKEEKLSGIVEIEDLLTSAAEKTLAELAETDIISVSPEMDQEEVSLLVSNYDLKVVPVIDEKEKMLGIITVDDVIDVIQSESTEDMLKMVGIDKEERVGSTLVESIKNRLPWLYINLGTAFLAALIVGIFEDVIAQVTALAVAMPVVAGMGGNAGSQTLAIIIREIALGELSFRENWRVVIKEAILGIIHGAAIGLLTAIILYINYGNLYLALIIFLAIVANLVMAGLSGFLIPVTLKGLGLDPALSAAIFLTTVTDVFGFFVFLGLARMVIEFL